MNFLFFLFSSSPASIEIFLEKSNQRPLSIYTPIIIYYNYYRRPSPVSKLTPNSNFQHPILNYQTQINQPKMEDFKFHLCLVFEIVSLKLYLTTDSVCSIIIQNNNNNNCYGSSPNIGVGRTDTHIQMKNIFIRSSFFFLVYSLHQLLLSQFCKFI